MRLISARTAAGETLGVVATAMAGGGRDAPRRRPRDDGGPAGGRPAGSSTSRRRGVGDDIPPSRIAGATAAPARRTRSSSPRVPRPGKVVAIGRNYREHADEEGVDPPPAPLVFAKWPSSVVGPRRRDPLGSRR